MDGIRRAVLDVAHEQHHPVLGPHPTKIREEGEVRTVMATNPPTGDGHRKGAVRDRSQVLNPHTDRYVKRDTDTGRFIDQKADPKPFKGVRREK